MFTDPTKFFGCELGAQTQFDTKNDRYIVNGSHDADKLQNLLDGFIKKFVLCNGCSNPETNLVWFCCRLVCKYLSTYLFSLQSSASTMFGLNIHVNLCSGDFIFFWCFRPAILYGSEDCVVLRRALDFEVEGQRKKGRLVRA